MLLTIVVFQVIGLRDFVNTLEYIAQGCIIRMEATI